MHLEKDPAGLNREGQRENCERGPKADPHRAETLHIAHLTRDVSPLGAVLIGPCSSSMSKKLAALLGSATDNTESL